MKNIHILKDFFQIIITLSLAMFASIPSFADDICEQYALDEEGCLSNAECEWIPPYTCRMMENLPGGGSTGGGTTGGGTTDTETDKDRFSFYASIEGTEQCENISITVANCTQSAVSKCNGKEVVTWRVDPGDTKAVTPAELCTFLTETSEDALSFRAIYADTTINCESGYYLHTGAISSNGCTLCEVGHKCIGGALTPSSEPSGLTACPSGTYQTQRGQAQCYNCTNKSSAGTYKSDETGISVSNACSWSMQKCNDGYRYDETQQSCINCGGGYSVNWGDATHICWTFDKRYYLCDASFEPTEDTVTYSDIKTCTPNKYTLNIYAEYMHNGIITKTEKIATNTLTYDSNPTQAIYSVYYGTQILNSTITALNKEHGAGKYFAPTSTGNAYLEINGTKYTLQSNYSGGSSGSWTMYANDHAVLAELPNGTTIDMYLKIQTESYNVYMISSGVTDSGPGNTFNIHTTPIVQKKFGSKPSDGVTPNKSLVTTCISGTNYAYIPDTATPKYYECTNTNQTASKVANTSNGSATMFEPSKSGNNICIAYQMTTCGAGYSCNSCERTACNNGKYQPDAGQASCKTCLAGTVSANDNLPHTSCTNCYNGQYQPNDGQASCETCPSGSYTTNEDKANSECVGCPAGTYGDRTKCDPCPVGTYQPEGLQTTCISCQDGIAQETPEETSGLFTTEIKNGVGATNRTQCYIDNKINFIDNNQVSKQLLQGTTEKIYWRGS